MKKTVLPVIVLAVFAFGAYLVWSRSSVPESAMMAPIVVQAEAATYAEETDTYEISAAYPTFAAAPVDAAVKKVVDDAIAAFKAYPTDTPPVDSLPKNFQDISYETVYTGPDYVSVELLISEYTGGAHPNSVTVGVNVMPDGTPVALVEVLNLIGKSLQQVAVETDAELKVRLAEAYFADGATPIPDNYSTFLIGEDTVTFVFNPYQVGPYAAGPQEVTFQRVR